MHKRQFLQMLLGLPSLAFAAGADPSNTHYRALVCIFLHGGNDAHNTVLNTSDLAWSHYAACRPYSPDSVGLNRSSVIPLELRDGHPDESYGLHPSLAQTAKLFNQGDLSVLANIGPLEEPTSKEAYEARAVKLPKGLFSHNDQQSTWQTFGPEGTQIGWGGQIADKVRHLNGQDMFTAISMAGSSAWLNGRVVRPYQADARGGIRLGTQLDAKGEPRVYGSALLATRLQSVLSTATTSQLAQDAVAIHQRAMQAERILERALPRVPADELKIPLAWECELSHQLKTVVTMMRAHRALGIRRQFFFVGMHGFDTHDRQKIRHRALLADLDKGLAYFNQALKLSNLFNSVTTFTASEFGRTLTTNGDGTDHGWGGHHFVMGGQIRGQTICGALPPSGWRQSDNHFDEAPHLIQNGVLIPQLSCGELHHSLDNWMSGQRQTSDLAHLFRPSPH